MVGGTWRQGVAWSSRRTTAAGGCVTEEIPDQILASLAGLEGQHLEVTILFADLRDFTPWVEATPVREVVRDLGAYFTEMEQAIRGEGGLVLQFIGDEIEAVFDAGGPRGSRAPCGAGLAGDAPASGRLERRSCPAASTRHRGAYGPRAGW